MPTKREYLVEKGLARPGRGRFSREALAVIAQLEADGMVFSDPGKAEKSETEDSPAPLPRPAPVDKIMRRESVAWATITLESSGRTLPVALAYCGKCSTSIRLCRCPSGPRIPSWIDKTLPPASLTRPKETTSV